MSVYPTNNVVGNRSGALVPMRQARVIDPDVWAGATRRTPNALGQDDPYADPNDTPEDNAFMYWTVGLAALGLIALTWGGYRGVSKVRRGIGSWRVKRLERKALFHQEKADTKIHSARAMAAAYGLPLHKIRDIEEAAGSKADKINSLLRAIGAKKEDLKKSRSTFRTVVGDTNEVVGKTRTSKVGGRPTEEWKRTYRELASASGVALPDPGTDGFSEALKAMGWQ